MTPAELTALLAPVRAELDAIQADADRRARTGDTVLIGTAAGMRGAAERVRAELDKLDPHAADAGLVVLGIAALGLLKELKESEELGRARAGFDSTSSGEDWRTRADALLAAAYPAGPHKVEQETLHSTRASVACPRCGARFEFYASPYSPPIPVSCTKCGRGFKL